jgi:HAD superfamily phosphoserine phosphatase-like hydrolase
MESGSKFKKEQVVIFDLCGTLYDSNTTFEFLDLYIYPISKFYRFVRKITKLTIWRAFNKILFKLLSLDLTRYLALKSLNSVKTAWLQGQTHHFFTEVLVNKQIVAAQSLLKEAQKTGCKIILMSASLDFIVAEAATRLGISHFYASNLGYDNDSCTGHLTKDLLGKKTQLCDSEHIPLSTAIVVTDNLSDLSLVKKSAHAYIVTNKKNATFWLRLENINMIYV